MMIFMRSIGSRSTKSLYKMEKAFFKTETFFKEI